MRAILEAGLDGGPSSVGVVGWDDDGNLIANLETEISDRSVENFVLFAIDFDKILIVVTGERADDGFALDRANLLVHEFAAFANSKLQNVTFDELGL